MYKGLLGKLITIDTLQVCHPRCDGRSALCYKTQYDVLRRRHGRGVGVVLQTLQCLRYIFEHICYFPKHAVEVWYCDISASERLSLPPMEVPAATKPGSEVLLSQASKLEMLDSVRGFQRSE